MVVLREYRAYRRCTLRIPQSKSTYLKGKSLDKSKATQLTSLVGAIALSGLLASCIVPAPVAPAEVESRDIESCVAIFDTTEEELGLTAETDVATGQRNYATWIQGMLGDAEDAMLRSYGLAAAGASRAAADKFEEQGSLGPDDVEVLVLALLRVQERCKQVMGVTD